jgi:hypothetical protein
VRDRNAQDRQPDQSQRAAIFTAAQPIAIERLAEVLDRPDETDRAKREVRLVVVRRDSKTPLGRGRRISSVAGVKVNLNLRDDRRLRGGGLNGQHRDRRRDRIRQP